MTPEEVEQSKSDILWLSPVFLKHLGRDPFAPQTLDILGGLTWLIELHNQVPRSTVEQGIFNSLEAQRRREPPQPPPPPVTSNLIGRLKSADGNLIGSGKRFDWRFCSAFQLAEQIAHGREAEAVAFLEWARRTGFNGVRVLMTAKGLFDLSPADGQRWAGRLLALAREHDLYAEVVALADTKTRGLTRDQMKAHVKTLGSVAASPLCDNAVFQLGNELDDSTQSDLLIEKAFLRELRGLVPAAVPTSYGAWRSDEELPPYGAADFITTHPDRSRPKWDRTRHLREIAIVASQSDVYAVADEPIGADERDDGSRRSADPNEHYAIGALTRFFNAGATFHFQAGLFAKLPGPNQQKCAEAFVAGATLAPAGARFEYHNAGRRPSPVAKFNVREESDPNDKPNSAIRAYSFLSGQGNFVALVGVTGDPGIQWAEGWKPAGVAADKGGFRVLKITR